MTRQPVPRNAAVVGMLIALTLQVGCKTEEHPSALIGRYTFSRDFDEQRRVLRIEPSSTQPADCMLADLPVGDSAAWKQTELDPAVHSSLIELLLDEDRAAYYKADTQATAAAETFVCNQLLDGKEYCYAPQVVVTGVHSPWRFGLQPEVDLSAESIELIDAFLSAHDTCWNSETAMGGGS